MTKDGGGPTGAREASSLIDPDEDKWTGPIWPPCGEVSSTGTGEGGWEQLVG